MTKLERFIFLSAPMRFLYRIADKIFLPGFEGFSLYQVGKFFRKEMRDTNLNIRVAAVTYNFIMAIPPTMLFLFSLVPYLPLRDVQETILDTLHLVTPNQRIYDNISAVVVDFMNTQHRDFLSFGILLTVFFSSNGMMGLMRTFDRSLALYKKRSGLKRRWTAIKLTFMLICVAITTLAILIVQTETLNAYVLKIFGSIIAVKLLSLLIFILIIFLAVSIVYRYGPSLSHKVKFVSAGSVMATILSVLTTTVFFFLVNNIINYNKVYGSIGSLIAFMVWVWLNTLVIILGYELNVSILLGKISRTENEAKQKDQ
ncbi:YihY/virulence factor BrkB family protein [Chitinophagaceae bacterium MMS25-I14]